MIIEYDAEDSVFKAVSNHRVIGWCYAEPDTFPSEEAMEIKHYANHKNQMVHITSLEVEYDYRGRYVGTLLLYHTLRYYYRRGFKYAALYDASARSRKKTCIYRRLGFRHLTENGKPTCNMVGNIRHILYGKFRGMNGKNRRADRFYRRNMIVPRI